MRVDTAMRLLEMLVLFRAAASVAERHRRWVRGSPRRSSAGAAAAAAINVWAMWTRPPAPASACPFGVVLTARVNVHVSPIPTRRARIFVMMLPVAIGLALRDRRARLVVRRALPRRRHRRRRPVGLGLHGPRSWPACSRCCCRRARGGPRLGASPTAAAARHLAPPALAGRCGRRDRLPAAPPWHAAIGQRRVAGAWELSRTQRAHAGDRAGVRRRRRQLLQPLRAVRVEGAAGAVPAGGARERAQQLPAAPRRAGLVGFAAFGWWLGRRRPAGALLGQPQAGGRRNGAWSSASSRSR